MLRAVSLHEAVLQRFAPPCARHLGRVPAQPQALTLRYGEPRHVDVLTVLAAAVPAALGFHWLGLTDFDGSVGLEDAVRAAAGSTPGSSPGSSGGGGRRRVELNLEQLGALSSEL
jgi:hypothetical protein